jgi:hypothetical protein
MNKMAKWTALLLVALCALAVPAVMAPAAFAQGAEEEYNLDLPGSGGDQTTPATNTSADTSDSDDGGFPVLAIILFAAAGVAVGLALWRLAVTRRMDQMDDDGTGS